MNSRDERLPISQIAQLAYSNVTQKVKCAKCGIEIPVVDAKCKECGRRSPLQGRISKDDFIALYSQHSCAEIAEKYDVSVIYVQKLKRDYGIATKNKVGVKRDVTPEKWRRRGKANVVIDPKEFERLYLIENKNMDELSQHYGVSRQTLSKFRKKHNINRKGTIDYSDYVVDESFFSVWSNKMAWVLGLIITDGAVCEGPWNDFISFSSTDKELPQKILKAMNSNYKINEKQPRGDSKKTQYWFNVTRQRLVDDIKALGVYRKKSLTVNWPEVPSKYLPDFIRGVFEGDGSVYKAGNGLNAKFVSGSKSFICGLGDAMKSSFLLDGNLNKDSHREFYQLRFCKQADVKRLGHIMYDDQPLELCLERKKSIFENIIGTGT